ncbi:flavodoxin domain-containing protein [Marinospirillum alkaliphilum]|uniref:Flavodoxin n=1 Tax=Marinospirillum alkaliphilum DSM 21637 TaxID=1122209 RepID=A0A1K1TCT6_9GAMM|nr:flavodoxin domain-containing protein [Marinospirillum alkaliphilum]SFW98455.1 Flavodoxin [Marinospirillum alkaliphilum DSM 21637]
MADILVLVGSVYGGAEEVAEQAVQVAESRGFKVRMTTSPVLQDLDGRSALLVVTSTTGSGELPDAIQPLYAALQNNPASLSGRPLGIIALGDSSYGETFCAAGQLFEELMSGLGAVCLQEMLRIDALEHFQATDAAREWIDGWLEALQEFNGRD